LAKNKSEEVIDVKNYEAIKNSELLTSVFGRWPSFHDAEVIWLHFDRRESPLGFGPTVETLIHAFEMTQEVDSNGYFVLRNHVLVHLRFSNVAMPEIGGFNHQNAINGLEIIDIRDRQMELVKFDVLFEPAYGLGAKFQCRDIEVVSVEPCDNERVGERGGARPVV
jgi:hypothetical protein